MAPSRSRSTSQAIAIYEDQPLPGDQPLPVLDGGLDHDADAFDSSELYPEGDTVIRSIETDDDVFDDRDPSDDHDASDDDQSTQRPLGTFRASHGYDRSFSSTSGIHLDEHISPHFSDDDDPFDGSENMQAPEGADYTDKPGFLVTPSKHEVADEAWVQTPDGDGFYRSPLPGRPMLNQHLRSPLSASKSHLASPLSPSPVAHRQSLLSSPTRPTPQGPGYVSPSRHNSANVTKERPVFRNPSSVRAMQMGSPPPFASPSPRSLRRRRQQSQASREATPSRHPNPQKEYPLVLLHCTLAPLPSTFAFTPAVLEAVLPEEKLRDLALLKEKLGLGTTVLERGVLLPHPRDDYDLLEERVLEALELRKPRIGACGHFLRDDHAAALLHDDEQDCADDCDARCADCERHVHPSLLEDGVFRRRWDVRVYAANGLMRAGAWGAAWREMEKVDVEVGIWISDSMRRRLEEYAREEMQCGVQPPMIAPEHLSGAYSPLPSERHFDEHYQPAPGAQHGRSTPAPAGPAEQTSKDERLPLSVLLQNYAVHLFQQKKDLVLGALVLAMGLWLARLSLVAPKSGEPLATALASSAVAAAHTHAPAAAVLATTTVTAPPGVETRYVTATVTETRTAVETATLASVAACSFASGEVGEGMTALPRDVAARVLELAGMSTSTAVAEAEATEGLDGPAGALEAADGAVGVDESEVVKAAAVDETLE